MPKDGPAANKHEFEDWIRKLPVSQQLAFTAGVIGLSAVVVPTFNIAGVIAMTPVWRSTWRALTMLKGELEAESNNS